MPEVSSTKFDYHNETRELVKYRNAGDVINWVVFALLDNDQKVKVFEFTDLKFSTDQAIHMATHMVRMYNAGVDSGRTQVRNEIYSIIHG